MYGDINGYQIISDLPIDLPILFGDKLWIIMVNWFQNLEQSHFGTGTQMATQKKGHVSGDMKVNVHRVSSLPMSRTLQPKPHALHVQLVTMSCVSSCDNCLQTPMRSVRRSSACSGNRATDGKFPISIQIHTVSTFQGCFPVVTNQLIQVDTFDTTTWSQPRGFQGLGLALGHPVPKIWDSLHTLEWKFTKRVSCRWI